MYTNTTQVFEKINMITGVSSGYTDSYDSQTYLASVYTWIFVVWLNGSRAIDNCFIEINFRCLYSYAGIKAAAYRDQ